MLQSKHNNYGIPGLLILIIGFQFLVPVSANAQKDSLAFGDKKWISNGLKGDIYFLASGTQALPNFDTMKSAGIIYTQKIDVPERSWTTGFPGVPNRFEWFAVVYNGSFHVMKPGHYTFRLLSDDGSKLYIDKKLVIDNDGVHGATSKIGDLTLNASSHSIRLEYFQGPATEIALQLFATLDKESEQIFPGNNFTLTTPNQKKTWKCWLIYIGIGLLILLILWIWWRRKRKIPTD